MFIEISFYFWEISKELSDRARSAPLVKKFALPPTETLINGINSKKYKCLNQIKKICI